MVYLFFRPEVLRPKDRIGAPPTKSLLTSPSGAMSGSFHAHHTPHHVNNYNSNCFEVMFFIFYRAKVICFNFFQTISGPQFTHEVSSHTRHWGSTHCKSVTLCTVICFVLCFSLCVKCVCFIFLSVGPLVFNHGVLYN